MRLPKLIMAHSSMKPRHWHYWISLPLLLAMVPLLQRENLPLKFDWITLGIAYWFVLAAQSIFVAVLLCLIGLPVEQVLRPFVASYRERPLRLIPLMLFIGALIGFTGWLRAMVLGVDAIALLELRQARKSGIAPGRSRDPRPRGLFVLRIFDGSRLQQHHRLGTL